MKVEIWSDIACPWCYIGKRRFEAALANFEGRDAVEITWRSFELDPGAPKTSDITLDEMLAKKYGMSPARAAAMQQQVTSAAAGEGLEYHLDRVRPSNTFDAHRLIHFAAERGLGGEMKERLLRAYFTEAKPVGERDTLVALAVEVGLDAEDARRVLDGEAFGSAVRADVQRAREIGVRGVPFFVIDERYGVSGAQPTEAFAQVLAQAWSERSAGSGSGDDKGAESTDGAGACDATGCKVPDAS